MKYPRWSRALILMTAIGAMCLGAGCGGSDEDASSREGEAAPSVAADREAITKVFETWKDALYGGKAARACAVMTERAQAELAAFGRGASDCETRFAQLVASNREGRPGDPKPRIARMEIDGGRATATLVSPGGSRFAAPFVRQDGEWKIDSGFMERQ